MQYFKCERILVPTDLSPFAERAVQYAHGLAELCRAELHVLHVCRDAGELAHSVIGVIDPDEETDGPGRWLATLLGEPGTIRRTEAVRVSTDIPGAIAAYAARQGADLIVIASHGRSGLSHLVLGSVAEQLLRTAPCPVLVIRPKP
jgi:nucleotide-binding universal stress UspA family protein